MPSLIENPAFVIPSRKRFAFDMRRSRSSVVEASKSTTAIDAPAIAGAIEFEKRYGRERWRKRSTIAFLPVVNPPAAPPSALPSVEVITSMRPMTPQCSCVPRPVLPTKPVAWLSSTITIAS